MKRQMLAAASHASGTLAFFDARPSASASRRHTTFPTLPNGGQLLYERYDWGMTGARWHAPGARRRRASSAGAGRVTLTVLSVAYPLAPVGLDAVGGAEQVLTALDRALVAAGHRSLVVACEGSSAAGQLVAVPREGRASSTRRPGAGLGAAPARRSRLRSRRWPVDLVHLHGIDFRRLPAAARRARARDAASAADLVSGRRSLRPARPGTWLHCVCRGAARRPVRRRRTCWRRSRTASPSRRFAARHAKRGFALVVGRICPEKGVHLAIEAAKTRRHAAAHRRRGVRLRGAPRAISPRRSRRGSIAGAASSGRSASPASAAS